MRLTLLALGFDSVTFELVEGDDRRFVCVMVGSGRTWLEATRYPNLSCEHGETTGNDAWDMAIRRRAAEELIRLAAAKGDRCPTDRD